MGMPQNIQRRHVQLSELRGEQISIYAFRAFLDFGGQN
jgi:hypothetical protein